MLTSISASLSGRRPPEATAAANCSTALARREPTSSIEVGGGGHLLALVGRLARRKIPLQPEADLAFHDVAGVPGERQHMVEATPFWGAIAFATLLILSLYERLFNRDEFGCQDTTFSPRANVTPCWLCRPTRLRCSSIHPGRTTWSTSVIAVGDTTALALRCNCAPCGIRGGSSLRERSSLTRYEEGAQLDAEPAVGPIHGGNPKSRPEAPARSSLRP